MKYRAEIDGLRAVAVIPVILFHAGFSAFAGGFIGVDVFFVISGYLITTIIALELDRGDFTILGFYDRRARRILPALFFVILCCLPFAWMWMLPKDFEAFGIDLIATVAFAANIELALGWNEYFGTEAEKQPLLHMWSLAVEEQYYIFFPILLMLIWRFGNISVFLVIIVIAIGSLAAAEIGSRVKPVWNFYLLPTRAWELLAGALCALVLLRQPPTANNAAPSRIADAMALVGLGMILASIALFDHTTPFPSVYALLPVGGTCLVILFARSGTLVARLLSIPSIVGIGLISYSAYLWHQPLFAFARIRLEEPSVLTMLLLTLCSLALAVFSWKVIEQPFRGRRNIATRMPRIAIGSAAAIATGFVGLGLYARTTDGAVTRFPAEMQALLVNGDWSRRCLTEPEEPMQDRCIFGGGAPGPRIAILGDSIAASLAPALIDNVRRRQSAEVHQFTHTHCLPTLRTVTAHPADNPCADFIRTSIEQINRLEPDAVVISANWGTLTASEGLLYDGVEVQDDIRVDALSRDIMTTMAKIDAPVILLMPFHRAGYNVLDDVFQKRISDPDAPQDFAISQTEFLERFEDAFAILEAVEAPNVRRVQIHDALCDGTECHIVQDGQLLLSDEIHVTRFGADRIVGLPSVQEALRGVLETAQN